QTPSGAAGGSAGGLFGLLGAGLRLGLWRRFERRFADCRLLDEPGIAEETRHPVAGLRSDPEPMLDPLFLQGHAIGVAAIEHRVVGAELLDKPPVARAARVGNDDRVERPLLGAATGEPNFQ